MNSAKTPVKTINIPLPLHKQLRKESKKSGVRLQKLAAVLIEDGFKLRRLTK